MKPLHHAAVTVVLGAPADWDHSKGECQGLPITHQEADGVPSMLSVWELTDEERRAVAMGAPIVLRVFGDRHPPVWVEVL